LENRTVHNFAFDAVGFPTSGQLAVVNVKGELNH